MDIKRIYNNNVVVTTDVDGQDMIVIGRGLAFGKRPGDLIDPENVEQVFRLSGGQPSERLADMLPHIDDVEVYLPIAGKILSMLREEADSDVSESLLLTLTDHISSSVERERRGSVLKNTLLSDIKQLYRREFCLAQKAAAIILSETGVQVSEDEIGFITLHIVNAIDGESTSDLARIAKIVSDIQRIVEKDFGIKLKTDSLRYERFIRHLQFFARRVLDEATEQESNPLMFELGKREFPQAYNSVRHIAAYMRETCGRDVSEAEQGYLTYHIMNVIIASREKE